MDIKLPWDALDKSSSQALLADRDGLQGANRSHSRRYGEDLQHGRPPKAASSAARALVQSIPCFIFLCGILSGAIFHTP